VLVSIFYNTDWSFITNPRRKQNPEKSRVYCSAAQLRSAWGFTVY
jgi:hypothetical protein